MLNNTRFSAAFVTILVILSAISIKMAYLHGADALLFLIITIPMIISILTLKKIRRSDYDT